jgi:hypothetical protein
MPKQANGGGKGGSSDKCGRNIEKGARWRLHHGNKPGHKFEMSKEHRFCGPIGYKNRLENTQKAVMRLRKEERARARAERVEGDAFDPTNLAVIAGNIHLEPIRSRRAPISVKI